MWHCVYNINNNNDRCVALCIQHHRRVVLHNIKFDERVMEFSNASGVGLKQDLFLTDTRTNEAVPPVRAVAFRTGGGVPLMVAGGDAGVVTVWDLEKRRLHSVIKVHCNEKALYIHSCIHIY